MDVYDNSILTIEGIGFNYPYGVIASSTGRLTGTLSNGDPIDNLFNVHGEASIVLIPAPATFYVDDDAPNDPGTGSQSDPFRRIQDAIDYAIDGDTVIVLQGIYYENIIFHGIDITLTSTDPNDSGVRANTVIDGTANGPVISFSGSESSNFLLTGFTVTNGLLKYYVEGSAGNGISGNGSNAAIDRCVITGNGFWPYWTYGGGISNCHGIISN